MPLMTSVVHEVVHQHPETGLVGRLQQVGHPVDQHVFQAFGRFFASSLNDKGYHAVQSYTASGDKTLFDLGGLQCELESLLSVHVDLLTPADLPLKFRAKVLEDAQPV
jgi:hypothetical protein